MAKKFTTVHSRYQISDSCCGLVEVATSFREASEVARRHASRHAKDGDDSTLRVEIFDVMARRHCQDTWEFPIARAEVLS